jgi:hypothetical protein
MTIQKKFLIMRHGPSIEAGPLRNCRTAGRLKLAKSARRFLGAGRISIFTAPEWDTRYTAKCVAKLYEAAKPEEEPSLSHEHDGPVDEDFARKRLADTNPDVIMTHYKRLDLVLAAIEKAAGIKLQIDKARMRHLNRAYLVDLEEQRVFVIKEKS